MAMDHPNSSPPPIPPQTLSYAPAPRRIPQRRGFLPLSLALGGCLPAILSLLGTMSGPYIDPFALIILIPVWAIALALCIGASVTLVISAQDPRSLSDLQSHAFFATIILWVLLGATLFIYAMRS